MRPNPKKTSRGVRFGQWMAASWRPNLLRPFVLLMCMFAVATMMVALVNNMDWKSFKHLAFDSGYSHVKVIKSESDTRSYRFFVLPNGLQVLAVSDPTADRVAASMDVSVGHFSDPEDLPGLAHFLEHMLFMGSKKYPDENQYSAFLAQHGGHSNAYTAAENTNYQFEITPEFFRPALDTFAQFFVAPLLRDTSTVREVKAVENEHIKNLQSDGWRMQQLKKSVCNPKHPNHKFGTGNLQTLCNNTYAGNMANRCEGTLAALRSFYRRHYVAPRMRLAVIAREPMGEIEDMVRESFSSVPADGGLKEPEQWDAPVRPESARGARMIRLVPITDQRLVTISWQLPPMYLAFRQKAASYLSHLVGHEAKGSVAALLKKRGLIESLSAGAETEARYGAEFDVSVSLTQLGLERVDEVLRLIFGYIRLLRTTGPQEWVWKESKALSEMHFRFKEKSDPVGYAVDLASNMQIYPPQYVIAAPFAYEKYDPALIEDLFRMLDPAKADVFLCARKFHGTLKMREAVYGTEYEVARVPSGTLDHWKDGKIDPDLHLVNPNPFVPSDFALVPPHGRGAWDPPRKLVDREGQRLWHKQDIDGEGKNWKAKPKLSVMFQVTTPVASQTARTSVLTQLFTMLYQDSLTLTTYDATMAGLSWGLGKTDDGVTLSVGGYSHKLPRLLTQVTKGLVRCMASAGGKGCAWEDENRFQTIKVSYIP